MNKLDKSRISWIEILSVTSSVFTIIGISILGVGGGIKHSAFADVVASIVCTCLSLTAVVSISVLTITILRNQAFVWKEYGDYHFWAILIFVLIVVAALILLFDHKILYKLIYNSFSS